MPWRCSCPCTPSGEEAVRAIAIQAAGQAPPAPEVDPEPFDRRTAQPVTPQTPKDDAVRPPTGTEPRKGAGRRGCVHCGSSGAHKRECPNRKPKP